ncbi:MAG: hypothetical protein B7Y37_07030 [Sphingobacteriia bacterium 28-36-52]|nr:MAG: hypothetical protein B7Z27_03620 [Sphingobacteriia bacterium 32-37-4]OYZ01417.1 MAG: hypothetical protein B7Y37_07030 [Sphingobacteriia bacterium 28-36-52]
MLTATDLTGEETHEKKNPRFLLLVLALFIMAGIGYAAFWWIAKQETIVPIVEEKETVDASAQAWYDEQRKIMEANLNLQPDSAEAAVLIDSTAINSSTIDSAAEMPTVVPPEPKPKPVEEIKTESPKPAQVKRVKSPPRSIDEAETEYIEPVYKPVRSKKVISDNIKPTDPTQYFQQENSLPQYSGSVPPTNNKRPIEPVYIPVQKTQKETEKNAPSFYSSMITREELEEFMRQFPYKKTTIQFVCYVRPNEDMEAMKGQIIQFLRQNGYTDMETNWNIWSDHTPIKEVHYGKSGATGANFYIPSFR